MKAPIAQPVESESQECKSFGSPTVKAAKINGFHIGSLICCLF